MNEVFINDEIYLFEENLQKLLEKSKFSPKNRER